MAAKRSLTGVKGGASASRRGRKHLQILTFLSKSIFRNSSSNSKVELLLILKSVVILELEIIKAQTTRPLIQRERDQPLKEVGFILLQNIIILNGNANMNMTRLLMLLLFHQQFLNTHQTILAPNYAQGYIAPPGNHLAVPVPQLQGYPPPPPSPPLVLIPRPDPEPERHTYISVKV
ncbi:hypothetical protein COLO4_05808 [Corchorus olitorius]|uniref:Uncharacterized protein n=1 Tax=Corchorus olitorius TaxID=93759 RepID=A0A1R3KPT3_9ROSI|nr:hypothetical protein COLO4_05808 [Corchorus olitorius]